MGVYLFYKEEYINSSRRNSSRGSLTDFLCSTLHTTVVLSNKFNYIKISFHWSFLPKAGPPGQKLVKIKLSKLCYLWVSTCHLDPEFIYNSDFAKDTAAAVLSWKLICITPLLKVMLILAKLWSPWRSEIQHRYWQI